MLFVEHKLPLIIFVIEINVKLEETVHNIKTAGLKNPESYVLTHNRFKTYMVLIFSDINKAQIYKIPYRDKYLNFMMWTISREFHKSELCLYHWKLK